MTDDTATAKLAEWEALANAATEGPWEWIDGPRQELANHTRGVLRCAALAHPHPADANFIAAAREMVPALLGFVREVRALHASSEATRGVGQIRDGAWTAYCEEDLEDWPCPTEQAARKWLGGEA